jgi:hypothetical protein
VKPEKKQAANVQPSFSKAAPSNFHEFIRRRSFSPPPTNPMVRPASPMVRPPPPTPTDAFGPRLASTSPPPFSALSKATSPQGSSAEDQRTPPTPNPTPPRAVANYYDNTPGSSSGHFPTPQGTPGTVSRNIHPGTFGGLVQPPPAAHYAERLRAASAAAAVAAEARLPPSFDKPLPENEKDDDLLASGPWRPPSANSEPKKRQDGSATGSRPASVVQAPAGSGGSASFMSHKGTESPSYTHRQSVDGQTEAGSPPATVSRLDYEIQRQDGPTVPATPLASSYNLGQQRSGVESVPAPTPPFPLRDPAMFASGNVRSFARPKTERV